MYISIGESGDGGEAKKRQTSLDLVSNNQFRTPLFVIPFHIRFTLNFTQRGGSSQIWNYYKHISMWHDVSNCSFITVRELNKNFPSLNF